MITKIKVKPKGQNTHSIKLIKGLLQALASVDKNFVFVDREHYVNESSSWLERPFHFELYHQLRLKFRDNLEEYTIQGEIEKSSHSSGVGNLRPDLIFHIPGVLIKPAQLMHIEIKPVKPNDNAHLKKIIDDLKKLSEFKDRLSYKISVLVLFGPKKELAETTLFIEGKDSNNEDLNIHRDNLIRDIREKNQELFLIELDISIFE